MSDEDKKAAEVPLEAEDFQVSRRATEEQNRDLLQEAEIQSRGRNLVSRLAMLFKTVRLHSAQNEALRYSVKILVEASNALYTRLGDYTLRGDVNSVFINDIRIRPDPLLWDNIGHLLDDLASRGVGGISFAGPLSPLDVRLLLQTLQENPSLELGEGANVLTQRMLDGGVSHVRFLRRMSLVTSDQAIANQTLALSEQAIRVYTELLVTWKAYLESNQAEVPDIISSRLLVAIQNAVDMHHEDPDWFLSTSCFRRASVHVAVNAVNQVILAICLGAQLDFTRKMLMNLGMSTLYASAGFRNFGVNGDFEIQAGGPADRLGIEAHPLNSVKEILQTPALTRGQRDRILVAYEHRMNRDGTGYPKRVGGQPKHLFSEIVSLVGRYTELTSDFHNHEGIVPTAALEQITVDEKHFDPRLVRVFIRMMGPFPIGSFVELSTGEVAVVFRQAEDPRLCRRPTVKIVLDEHGRRIRPTLYSLASCDNKGNFRAGVVRPVDAKSVDGVEPTQVVFWTNLDEEPAGKATSSLRGSESHRGA
jgi:hypothetical protein